MEREHKVGASVIYVNPVGKKIPALVTVWWTSSYFTGEPGCNLVFVSDDEMKTDTYGRQIDRSTSVVHKSHQPAHGNYWHWPDEA